ncbi:hypothetical protein RclHR1_05520010 [Rhizophagus clarus]|uniref:F-box domain-containing protein n=1 Tax=Rhizophagus clarus TaxID=94130 RepID=A0A2Z6S629_9GLOM|nr:hypothetical protein RclHR1_05520010 [Rhizophagus clarus]GES90828.1 hypothetical protein GLOIN_2v1649677 [Rhizophagus clarus]
MSKFTVDCLYVILKELKRDFRSLHSCLLVNRLWCKIVVPILWRNPWKFYEFVEFTKRDQKFLKSFYKILILLLPPESKELLINNGINIFPTSFKKPLFNYVYFIKSLNIYVINQTTQKLIVNESPIVKQVTDNSQLNYHKFLFEQEILKLIISQSQGLKHLSLDNDNIKQFYYLPGAKECLTGLASLTCGLEVDPLIFYGLSQICRNIKKLRIYDCLTENDGLTSLIIAQKNLQYFICEFDRFDYRHFVCKGIGNALVKQAHSLKYFDSFDGVTFHPSIFKNFVNLRELKLGDGSLIRDYDLHLQQAMLPSLQYLEIGWTSLYTIAKIIQSTKGDLVEIRVIAGQNFTKKNTKMYLQSITKNCPKLKMATLFYYGDKDESEIKEFKKLLTTCLFLEHMVLIRYKEHGLKDYDNELLDVLGNHAPISLKSIQIQNLCFSPESLVDFFEKWKQRKIPLSFYYIYDDDIFKNIISEYIREGVIKDFKEVDDEFY